MPKVIRERRILERLKNVWDGEPWNKKDWLLVDSKGYVLSQAYSKAFLDWAITAPQDVRALIDENKELRRKMLAQGRRRTLKLPDRIVIRKKTSLPPDRIGEVACNAGEWWSVKLAESEIVALTFEEAIATASIVSEVLENRRTADLRRMPDTPTRSSVRVGNWTVKS